MAKSPVRRRQVQDPGMISTFSPFSPIIPCFLPLLPCPTVISQTSASMQTPVSSSTNSSSPKITSSAVHTSDPSFSLSSATGTQTSTSSASSPSATPDFAWMNFPASVELCSSPTFAWSYSGPRESLAFLVTANVSHSIITISSGVDSTLQFFTWHSVNISTGWYTLEASGDSVQAVSPEFTITGRDTACLITSASLFSSSTGTTSTPGTASAYIAALPSSPMTTTTLAAVSRRVSTAAIAGGAAAGVAVLIAATIGMCYLWRRAPRQRRAAVTRYNVWVERNRREVWDSLPPGTHSSGYIPAEKGDAAGLSLPRLEPNRRPPSALTDARGSRSSLLSDTMSMASLT
ncbi:hypothetical protein BD311DRAFT_796635 [Dichomitus squalens]|nr:hypothetical protein BD311DRAFT_796635 [Dichomitus squalens]